jgi:hypothetical protein
VAEAVETVASDEVVTLPRGQVSPSIGDVRLGFKGLVDDLGGAPLARISVATGQLGFEALVAQGERVRVGSAWVRVGVGAEAELAWEQAYPEGRSPDLIRDLPQGALDGGVLRLEEMGLYRLADGRVLAVGNVVAEPEGEGSAPAVVLACYPADYDGTQPHDRHFLAVAGEALEGEQFPATLARLQVAQGDDWGFVELRTQ